MAELITINLAANETKNFRRGGSGFEIIQSDYATGINLYSDQGSQIDSLSGALQGFFLTARFGAFDIKNGSIAQSVQLLLLDQGETGGTRRQSGIVEVTDTFSARTRAGKSFITGYAQWTVTGPVFYQYQLKNPAGSNKNAVITQIEAFSEVDATKARIYYGFSATESTGGFTGFGANKLKSGPLSVMSFRRTEETVQYNGLTAGGGIGSVLATTTGTGDLELIDPIIVEPGMGFWMVPQKSYSFADGAINVWIHYYEEAV